MLKSIKSISGRIYGTPDAGLWRYYRSIIRNYYRTGVQVAFRYY